MKVLQLKLSEEQCDQVHLLQGCVPWQMLWFAGQLWELPSGLR